jgi:P-type E1-E2 ATPase
MQKAQVTRLLKKKAGAVTLAIGDGANDVSMIQAAHIGVGISGREGRAAVQAADYAFGQFRFLVRLLLVHGRYSYLRCREVVLYAFYKNVAYVSCYVYYAFYSGGAGTAYFSMFLPVHVHCNAMRALFSALPELR